ncbi:hypothetical protein [Spirosoma areae]
MKHLTSLFAFCLLALCSCEEQAITRQQATTPTPQSSARQSSQGSPIKSGGQTLPPPIITKQTFIPAYSLFAETKCQAWRITWPTYPAGTDPNQIPTVFTVANGALNSFHYLNNTSASTTDKTNFNLYNNAQLKTANMLWSELKHVLDDNDKMDVTYFYKTNYSVDKLEYMVKERPSLFETYWTSAQFTVTNYNNYFTYQQGDIYLYKLQNLHPDWNQNPNRYGGIRIVSMSPRIIEVYLAEPNQ